MFSEAVTHRGILSHWESWPLSVCPGIVGRLPWVGDENNDWLHACQRWMNEGVGGGGAGGALGGDSEPALWCCHEYMCPFLYSTQKRFYKSITPYIVLWFLALFNGSPGHRPVIVRPGTKQEGRLKTSAAEITIEGREIYEFSYLNMQDMCDWLWETLTWE